MDIETRLSNIENLMNYLVKRIDDMKFYSDADTAGVRQGISDVTPYKQTQTAYYGEHEKVFYDVPQGNITVFWDNYSGDYFIQRVDDVVTVLFDTLNVAEATISISVS